MFFGGDLQLFRLADELIYGPFSEDQITYVHDSLAEKFDSISKKFSTILKVSLLLLCFLIMYRQANTITNCL